MTGPETLADWLNRLESRHDQPIALGLDRVESVRARMNLRPRWPVITVGGTNGKGSTCAYLEAILLEAGYRVGCYTSPHLLDYRERVRIDGALLDEARHVAAFAAVESARGDIPLTYFEQGTLAALWLFQAAELDALILEVGLGGRLDAVNVIDPDCAVVTTVDLDHQEYLGDTREAIGREKAGIFRSGRPAVVTDPDPPASLIEHAHRCGAGLLRLGHEIGIETGEGGWTCRVQDRPYPALPMPSLPGRFQLNNAAAAVAALHVLRGRLPVPIQALRSGLAQARPPGRFQVFTGPPMTIVDVAHNPQAARALGENLARLSSPGRRIAVLGVLKDKDVAGVVRPLLPLIDAWHAAALPGPRGLSAPALAEVLRAEGGRVAGMHPDATRAFTAARDSAGPADIIIVFGSFLTVAAALSCLQNGQS